MLKKSISILLVEDNRLIAYSLRKGLEALGSSVTTACSGEEAMQCVKTSKPDVILMDINLGEGRDGIEVMQQIHSEIGFIPNIYLTGYAENELADRIKSTSPASIFEKPVNTKLLWEAIISLD
jgi:CheY-like chemotaxis protein